MKIALNKCYGGFDLSDEATDLLTDEGGWVDNNEVRVNPDFIAMLEEKGSKWASASYAKLEVVTIPDNATDWEIDEYDGFESLIYVVEGKICHA